MKFYNIQVRQQGDRFFVSYMYNLRVGEGTYRDERLITGHRAQYLADAHLSSLIRRGCFDINEVDFLLEDGVSEEMFKISDLAQKVKNYKGMMDNEIFP